MLSFLCPCLLDSPFSSHCPTVSRFGSRVYARHVATTGAGHVIVAADKRSRTSRTSYEYQGVIAKYDGATGASVWVHDFLEDEVKYLYNVEAVDETVYLTGRFKGADIDPFNTGTYVGSSNAGGDNDAFIASLDVSGASGFVANWVV